MTETHLERAIAKTMYTRSEMRMAGCYRDWCNMVYGGSYWRFICAADYLNGRR